MGCTKSYGWPAFCGLGDNVPVPCSRMATMHERPYLSSSHCGDVLRVLPLREHL